MTLIRKIMFLMFATLLIGACKDPVEVTENNVPNGIVQHKYVYTVHVVGSSESGRTEGLKDATVTLSQKANVQSIKVNESGEAVFNNLDAGALTYFIKADGFASFNGQDDIEPTADELALINAPNDGNHQIEISRSSGIVTIPRMGASLKGIVLFDNDKNSATATTPAAGFKVKLQYNNSIQPNLYFATVGADGSFQFTNVPENPATISIDSLMAVGGQNFQYVLAPKGVNPSVGGSDAGVLTPASAIGSFISYTGTLKFKPWADFDYLTPNPAPTNYDPTSEVLPASVTITIDYSADAGFPKNVNPIFSGTRDATTGVWTFTKLPVGLTGKLVYSYDLTYSEGAGGCLIIPATGFTFTASAPYATSCSAVPVSYVRTITWNKFTSGGTVNIPTANQTVDNGSVQLSH